MDEAELKNGGYDWEKLGDSMDRDEKIMLNYL